MMLFDQVMIGALVVVSGALMFWIGWLIGHTANAAKATEAWRKADYWKTMYDESERRRIAAHEFVLCRNCLKHWPAINGIPTIHECVPAQARES